MAEKILGTGSKLFYVSTPAVGETPAVYTEVVDVVSISFEISAPDIDVTVLSSTAREYKPGLVDGGTVSFQVRFDPTAASHIALATKFRTTIGWKIVYSDDTENLFDAYLNKYSVSGVEVDGSVLLDGGMKVSGLPDLLDD